VIVWWWWRGGANGRQAGGKDEEAKERAEGLACVAGCVHVFIESAGEFR
jgi:hypothetical protein